MGYTSHTWEIVKDIIKGYNHKSILELGSQQDHTCVNKPLPFTRYFFENIGVEYVSIDMNGEDGALKYDLSEQVPFDKKFDIVTDIGCGEHIGRNGNFDLEATYNCWCNKHNLLQLYGIMINENPLKGNWPGHGFSYLTPEFYYKFDLNYHVVNYVTLSMFRGMGVEFSSSGFGYRVLDVHLWPAMSNTIDGWNVVGIMQKTSNSFPSFNEFKEFPIYTS